MTQTVERYEFQAETKELLDLMIHSIYSNKDIFLRELISNSSDALDKRRVESLRESAPEDAKAPYEAHILLEVDKTRRTLTVHDTGIGMSRDEVVKLIGTIAKSGTREFMKALHETPDKSATAELIGQFGVGFYATFMAAERVELVTRRLGESQATRWESTGDGTYTLEAAQRDAVGTSITLHLKPADPEDGLHDYTEEWTLREIVKKYSDFVAYPIQMDVTRTEVPRDAEGKPIEGAQPETRTERQTLNAMKAIWTRPQAEVTPEEYSAFYQHLSHDWTDPLKTVVTRMEGTFEAQALLFIPAKAPFDLFYREADHGIQLYVKRVFIMDHCKELMPNYLRFVKGVVDSEDLSLNISREILQQNRQIQAIRKNLVKKTLATLAEMKRDDAETYRAFWQQFGRVVKEGLYEDATNREALLDLTLFASTRDEADNALTDLRDYVARMQPGQDAIYYLTGESPKSVAASPHLEAFRAKGIEVLLLTDPVDEVWVQSVTEFDGKRLQSAAKGTVQLGSEEEQKAAEAALSEKEKQFEGLLATLKGSLEDHVKEVRLSNRLTESPACLVGNANDMTPQMAQLLRAMNQPVPTNKRILELNPHHPILEKLQRLTEQAPSDADALRDYAELLYGQALLAEGSALPDPARYGKLVSELMLKSVG